MTRTGYTLPKPAGERSLIPWIIAAAVLGVAALSTLIVILTKLEQIPPGYVGVSVKKCSSDQGVSDRPIPVGYYFRELWCEEVITYPISMQSLILTRDAREGGDHDQSITVTSSEGLNINLDVSLNFTLDPAKISYIYTRWRSPIKDIAHKYIRQTIREALQLTFAKYTAEELYSTKKEIGRLEVEKTLIEKLKDQGVLIQQFTINRIEPPAQVVTAINAKVAMTQDAQRSQQEIAKKEAEAKQKIAIAHGDAEAAMERARGEGEAIRIHAEATAQANLILSRSLTPQLVEYQKVQRWSGIMPQFMGGSATPLIQIR